MDAMNIHPYPDRSDVAGVTTEGAAWLASADPYPRSTLALWRERPEAPLVLPCGTAFDIVNVPAVFGRGLLDRLWEEGPGSGPVAVHRGRTLLFTAPGTARLLPRLLAEEKALEAVGGTAGKTAGECGDGAVPPLLCHGRGDAVTVPALRPVPGAGRRPRAGWSPRTPSARGSRGPRPCGGRRCGRPVPGPPRRCGFRFFLPPIRVLRSTTSAGAASSVG